MPFKPFYEMPGQVSEQEKAGIRISASQSVHLLCCPFVPVVETIGRSRGRLASGETKKDEAKNVLTATTV